MKNCCSLTDQEERTQSIDKFRKGEKDVLVATDVASKGLDFPNIQHVVNYDMPEDIENYGMIFCLAFCLVPHRVSTPTGKPTKWGSIFQSGKSQGILNMLEKSGNFTQNAGKLKGILDNLYFFCDQNF